MIGIFGPGKGCPAGPRYAAAEFADEMLRCKDKAARMISLKTGKPTGQAGREWWSSIDQIRGYAEDSRRILGCTVSALKAGITSLAMAATEGPFGGTNHSAMGREGGIEGIRDYLDVKSSQMVWA